MPLHFPQVSPVTSNTGTRHVQPDALRLLFFARHQRAGTVATADGPLSPLYVDALTI